MAAVGQLYAPTVLAALPLSQRVCDDQRVLRLIRRHWLNLLWQVQEQEWTYDAQAFAELFTRLLLHAEFDTPLTGVDAAFIQRALPDLEPEQARAIVEQAVDHLLQSMDKLLADEDEGEGLDEADWICYLRQVLSRSLGLLCDNQLVINSISRHWDALQDRLKAKVILFKRAPLSELLFRILMDEEFGLGEDLPKETAAEIKALLKAAIPDQSRVPEALALIEPTVDAMLNSFDRLIDDRHLVGPDDLACYLRKVLVQEEHDKVAALVAEADAELDNENLGEPDEDEIARQRQQQEAKAVARAPVGPLTPLVRKRPVSPAAVLPPPKRPRVEPALEEAQAPAPAEGKEEKQYPPSPELAEERAPWLMEEEEEASEPEPEAKAEFPLFGEEEEEDTGCDDTCLLGLGPHLGLGVPQPSGVAPEAKRESKRQQQREAKCTALPAEAATLACLTRSKKPLHDYQKRVVLHMLSHHGLLAWHATGSGKTITAVTTAMCLLDHIPDLKVVIVASPSLHDRFESEMEAYGLERDDPRFQLTSLSKLYKDLTARPPKQDCKGKLLIVDEAHDLRTAITGAKPSTRRATKPKKPGQKAGEGTGLQAKALLACAAKATRVLLLTATPMVNKPYDIANLIAMVNGDAEPLSSTHFAQMLYPGNHEDFEKYFRCKVSYYACAKDSDYYKANYPHMVDDTITLTMTPEYYKNYLAVQTEHINDLGGDIQDVLTGNKLSAFFNGIRRASNLALEKATKKRAPAATPLAASGTTVGKGKKKAKVPTFALDDSENPKVGYVIKQILEHRPDKTWKTLVYSTWLEAGIQQIADRLKQLRIPYRMVTGGKSKDARQTAVADFNTGRVRVLLISRAGGQGLDLRGTREVFLLEQPWKEAESEQAIARAVRFRSHAHLPPDQRVVLVRRLLLQKPLSDLDPGDEMPSIDTLLREKAEDKQSTIDEMTERILPLTIEFNKCAAAAW